MPGCLAGKRVLVLEDEYFIASDIRQLLSDQDAIVIGPVGSLSQGLALASDPIDLAVLDVNLEGEQSFEVADVLLRRAVPFMFVTDYDRGSLPQRYRAEARIGKPFTPHDIVQMARRLLSADIS